MTKQTFQIPDGCKAITMEQIGNQLVTTFEVEFKRGDVLISRNTGVLIIFKKYINEGTIESYFNSTDSVNYGWIAEAFRHATPEEAQQLWDALAKQGKRWNPKTMQVEPIRWRAEDGGYYYFIDSCLDVGKVTEDNDNGDATSHKSGNYFQTEEQAQRAADKLKQALDEFWKEELK